MGGLEVVVVGQVDCALLDEESEEEPLLRPIHWDFALVLLVDVAALGAVAAFFMVGRL